VYSIVPARSNPVPSVNTRALRCGQARKSFLS
jgi:hypothetical protein